MFLYYIIIATTQLIFSNCLKFDLLSSRLQNGNSCKLTRNPGRFHNKFNTNPICSPNYLNKNKYISFISGNNDLFSLKGTNYRNFSKFSKVDDTTSQEDQNIDTNLIRNFCIIAHVDHGKSTLADRFLEHTKSVPTERLKEQYLDNMELERERGITIKLQTALIKYKSMFDDQTYMLNLIDTPGHIDFNHEARRSISACEGAILVVDGTKGIEAQTVTTANIAIEKGLTIIPVVNKIDIEHCDFKATADSLKKLFNFSDSQIIKASAKKGIGIDDILEAIVAYVPPPKVNLDKPFRALMFDSLYDLNRGVICYVRVFDGSVKVGDEITLMNAEISAKVAELGVLLPDKRENRESLQSGQVGWITGGIKKTSAIEVGDTIAHKYHVKKNMVEPINKFESSKPTVFAGVYPCVGGDFDQLRSSLERLKLNDHSLEFEPTESGLIGHGFKCGFNGLLHLDIIVQRLEREFNTSVIVTSPSVPYRCTLRDGNVIMIDDASKWPDDGMVQKSEEPWTTVTIRAPQDSLGSVMTMLTKMRGRFQESTQLKATNMVILEYQVPLSEILSDFFNKLKSVTNGYGSFDYEGEFYEPIELCKVKILLNGDEATGLAIVTPKNMAYERGKHIVEVLAELIPRRQFKVPVQAVIGKRVIASKSIPPVRKDVIERCSGGDPSRKRKLLENQAKGKKHMAQVGSVTIPSETYNEIVRALRV